MNSRALALALALGLAGSGAQAANLYQNWYPNSPYVPPGQDYDSYSRYPGGFGYSTSTRGNSDPYYDASGYGLGYGYGAGIGTGYRGGYRGISFQQDQYRGYDSSGNGVGAYYESDYSGYAPPSYYRAPSADIRPYSYYNAQNNGRDYPASFYSGDGYDFNGHGAYRGYQTFGFRGISFNGGDDVSPYYDPNGGDQDPASYQGGIYPSPNRYSRSIGAAQGAQYGSPAIQGGFGVVPRRGGDYFAVAGGPLQRSQYYSDAVYTTYGRGFRPAGRASGLEPEQNWQDPPARGAPQAAREPDVRDAYPPAARSPLGPYPRGRMGEYMPERRGFDDERLRRRTTRCSERTSYRGTTAVTSNYCRPCSTYRAAGYERTNCGRERIVAKD